MHVTHQQRILVHTRIHVIDRPLKLLELESMFVCEMLIQKLQDRKRDTLRRIEADDDDD